MTEKNNSNFADDLATGINSLFHQVHGLVDDISEALQRALEDIEDIVDETFVETASKEDFDEKLMDMTNEDWNELLKEFFGDGTISCDNGPDLLDDEGLDSITWEDGYLAGYGDACKDVDMFTDPPYNEDGNDQSLSLMFEIFGEDNPDFDQETKSELKELIDNFLYERFGNDDLDS